MLRFARRAVLAGLSCAVLCPALAAVLCAVAGREVQIILPHAPEVVEMNRQMWTAGDPVAEIYGIPTRGRMHVLFPDRARLFVPDEDRSLTLLRVDKQAGDNPLQEQTVWFCARLGILAGLGLAALGAAAWLRARRRKPAAQPPHR